MEAATTIYRSPSQQQNSHQIMKIEIKKSEEKKTWKNDQTA